MKRNDIASNKTSGQTKAICPECVDTKTTKGDKCLSVNLDSGLYRCHYCGTSGILDDYRKISHITPEEKSYSLPPLNTTGLSQEQQTYLLSRGISVATANRNKITSSPNGWLEFNYYEHDTLVNIKYRSIATKKFMQHKGGKPIFYGLNDIILQETVIIVEGEIDKLSIEEAGHQNCVSVPLGAMNTTDTNFEGKLRCFEYASDHFQDVETIIIAVDNDPNGKKLRDEIARRMGKERCRWVDFGKYKDANEVLVAEGSEYLATLITQAKGFPIEGVIYISDVLEKIHDLYVNGAPTAYSAGLGPAFDQHFKIAPGFLTVVTGAPTSGKSNFVENIAYNTMVTQGWKWGSYSPEHPEELAFQRLARMRTGKYFFKGPTERMTAKELAEAVGYFQKHFYFVKHKMNNTVDVILDTMEQLVFKHGINACIIDPWTDIEHNLGGKQETMYVASSLARIKDFSRTYNLHTFLIAHPTKPRKDKDGGYIKPTLYDISGSANFYNKTDNGLIVHRNDEYVEVDIKKIKFEGIHGKQGTTSFSYNLASCTYAPSMMETKERVYKDF